ncbi:hypothetical protein C8Q70DRAFT_1049905 [Cubamyces menziesii]|nr:hypothetical protein C8Q70DRAFT_1049905 [Cubamyces menziesii]
MDVALDVGEVGPAAAERLKHAGMLEEQAPVFAQVPEGPACTEVDAFEIAVRPAGAEPLNKDDGMIVEASSEIRQVAPDPPNSPVLEEATSSCLVIKLPARPSPPRPRRSARTTMRKEGYNSLEPRKFERRGPKGRDPADGTACHDSGVEERGKEGGTDEEMKRCRTVDIWDEGSRSD